MNALEFLRDDHQKIQSLIQQIVTTPENGAVILPQFRQALLAHAHIEEKYFYPALEEYGQLRELVHQAMEEHKQAEGQLTQLSSIPLDDDSWQPLFERLRQDVEHHIREEEGELFPKVQRTLHERRLTEMGRELEIGKTEEIVAS